MQTARKSVSESCFGLQKSERVWRKKQKTHPRTARTRVVSDHPRQKYSKNTNGAIAHDAGRLPCARVAQDSDEGCSRKPVGVTKTLPDAPGQRRPPDAAGRGGREPDAPGPGPDSDSGSESPDSHFESDSDSAVLSSVSSVAVSPPAGRRRTPSAGVGGVSAATLGTVGSTSRSYRSSPSSSFSRLFW